MSVTFAVDAVTPAAAAPEVVALRDVMAAAFEATPYAVSHEGAVIEPTGTQTGAMHPLVEAVHRAFAEHRPLVLTPDAVWLTIAMGFGRHVERHAEALRARFVRHEGRETLRLRVGEMPQSPAAWAAVMDGFGGLVEEHVGSGMRRVLRCDFSTSTAVSRCASDVVMMSAFRRYFAFEMMCICGIPQITLAGTADDWRAIRARLDVIAEYDLQWWVERLAPVADAWVRAAEGEVDRDFWQCIYKPEEAYGGEVMTGWLARLFPYVGDEPGVRNPALGPEAEAAAGRRWFGRRKPRAKRSRWIGPGLAPSAVPSGMALARVTVVDARPGADPEAREMVRVLGGLCGVAVDADGALRAEPGWGVAPADPVTWAIEVLRRRGRVQGAVEDGAARLEAVSRGMRAFHAELGEVWFGGVHLRALADFEGMWLDEAGARPPRSAEVPGGDGELRVQRVADLEGDGRWLGTLRSGHVVLVDPARLPAVDELAVVADDYDALLVRVAEGGVWFDAPGYVPLATVYGLIDEAQGLGALLRPALMPGRPVPTDVSRGELGRLVSRLWYTDDAERRAHWWRIVAERCGVSGPLDDYRGRSPYEMQGLLGMG